MNIPRLKIEKDNLYQNFPVSCKGVNQKLTIYAWGKYYVRSHCLDYDYVKFYNSGAASFEYQELQQTEWLKVNCLFVVALKP